MSCAKRDGVARIDLSLDPVFMFSVPGEKNKIVGVFDGDDGDRFGGSRQASGFH